MFSTFPHVSHFSPFSSHVQWQLLTGGSRFCGVEQVATTTPHLHHYYALPLLATTSYH